MTLHPLARAARDAALVRRSGRVMRYHGLVIESQGPDVSVGEACDIALPGCEAPLRAEVVGVRDGTAQLMPYGEVIGLGVGVEVTATGQPAQIPLGQGLLGRVVDAFGVPIDGGSALAGVRPAAPGAPINPLDRRPITDILETRIKTIDVFCPLGRGQRTGIFAGSGVGKSTLLRMIARNVDADVVVIALVGERGREVQDFLRRIADAKGRQRMSVVVATSDQPALVRTKAARTALAIAEHFRDAGRNVLLIMDSMTRYAMAQREIGIAVGEPPIARGYTPSVFDALPRLVERCGNARGSGSLTSIMTVLTEGDDMNDPIADCARSILDGGIVLSRRLATHGIYPAIDILRSNSRLFHDLTTETARQTVARAVDHLSTFDANRELIEIGAYRAGTSSAIDQAIAIRAKIDAFEKQDVDEVVAREAALAEIESIVRN